MYRIELSPGEETAFRSIEELAVAIRRKVVTSRARIYHNATGRWLPIQFHPHYKLAIEMPLTQADLVAGPPVAPLSTLKLGESATRATHEPTSASREAATQAALSAWPEPKPIAPAPAKPVAQPAPAKPVAQPVPAKPVAQPAPKHPEPSLSPIMLGTPPPEPRRAVEPSRSPEPRRVVEPSRPPSAPRRMAQPIRFVEPRIEEPARPKGSRRRRKPLRSLRVALAGAVLIACAHLVVSAASTEASEMATARPRTPRRLIETPAEARKDVRPRTVAAVMPVLQSIPVGSLKAPNRTPKAATPKPAPIDSVSLSDSAPEIQPAPDAAGITVTAPAGAESLAPRLVDSTGKRNLKGLLHTISGSPAAESKARKR